MEILMGTYIDWGKSKEQAWSELEKRMEPVPTGKTRVMFGTWMKIAMAALVALLIGFSVFMQLYTKTITAPVGQHASLYLPDLSTVELNAQSTISYKPLLWKFSRKVRFEGEAFFSVQKGKKFQVISERGITNVLGTSFNIFSRNYDYQVTCISGNVKVTETRNSQAVVLNPGQTAIINPDGSLEVHSDISEEQVLSWLDNKFNFTSVPLIKVFEEIERQYGVGISIPEHLDSIYTGTFFKNTSVEQTLDLVCKPFHLTYTLKSKDEYIITRNAQKLNK